MAVSRRELLSAAPLLALGCATPSERTSTALRAPDLILVRGNVITMDPNRPRAEAVAIQDGRFMAVGSDADVRSLAKAGTTVVDLGGKTVLPGLIDAHTHGAYSGKINFLQVDLDVSTLDGLKDRLRKKAATLPAGQWIRAGKYDDTKLDVKALVTRRELDEAAPHHPVFVTHRSGHLFIANTAALKLAGVGRETPDPATGRMDRDGAGEPTGVFRGEKAAEIVSRHLPPFTREETLRATIQQLAAFAKSGLTGIHDAEASAEEFRAYADARLEEKLPLRVTCMIRQEEIGPLIPYGIRTGLGDDWLRVGATKITIDGAIAGRTARLSKPYIGRPQDFGLLTMSQEELDRKALEAHEAGWQIGVHANGDVAIDMVLRTYEKIQKAAPRPDPRFRIEHCTVVTPDLLRRVKALGVVPTPFCSYVYWHCEKWPEYGEDRLEWMFAMRSFLDHGIPATGSSDYIPGPFEPLMGIQSCVTRRGKDGKVWGGSQRITVEEAIRCYTRHGAYASFDESRKGSIEAGKLADLVVLGADPTKVDPETIMAVPVEGTMVGGRWVWRA
jgi:predicted amidohydrolase YtcJ